MRATRKMTMSSGAPTLPTRRDLTSRSPAGLLAGGVSAAAQAPARQDTAVPELDQRGAKVAELLHLARQAIDLGREGPQPGADEQDGDDHQREHQEGCDHVSGRRP